MSELYLDHQSEASTPNSGESVIYPKSDGLIYAKGPDGEEQILSNPANQETIGWTYKIRYTNESGPLLFSDSTIITYQSTDIVITAPLCATYPNDGTFREFAISNLSPYGSVKLQLQGSDVMSNGLSAMMLPYKEPFRFGVAYPTLGQGWSRSMLSTRTSQFRRNASWAESNFTSYTSIPWDTQDYNQDNLLYVWSAGSNPSRVTVKANGVYRISVFGSFDSTGGSASYAGNLRIRKNGTTVLPGSEQYVGNYKTEDSAIVVNFVASLAVDDYIEAQLYQTGLTGNAVNFVLTMTTEI